jgi:FkbM family methyltransferase
MSGKWTYRSRRAPFRLMQATQRPVRVDVRGRVLVTPADSMCGWSCFRWRPSWKSELIGKLLDIRQGAFVDVGAHAGETLLDLQSVAPARDYIGFEPNPECVYFLERVIAWNRLDRCKLIPVGLAARNEVLSLYCRSGVSADDCATLVQELRPGREYDVRRIPCFRFDDVWRDLGRPAIAAIKIDVEGAESQALSGMDEAVHRERPVIACEVLFADRNADFATYESRVGAISDRVASWKYSTFRIAHRAGDAVGLERLTRLPLGTYAAESADECDYLFVPEEQIGRVHAAMGGGVASAYPTPRSV